MVTYLSPSESIFYNIEILANNNAISTKEYSDARKKIIDLNHEKYCLIYKTAMIGLIVWGAVVAFTASGVGGGIIMASSFIPWRMNQKLSAILKIFQEELSQHERDLNELYAKMRLVFSTALSQMKQTIEKKWSEQDIDLDKPPHKEMAEENLKKMMHEIDELKFKSHEVSCGELKCYAGIISKNLSKPNKSFPFIKGSVFSPLKDICEAFNNLSVSLTFRYGEIADDSYYRKDRIYTYKNYTDNSTICMVASLNYGE